jgi:tetratricopeptide (TPR) repeat protein
MLNDEQKNYFGGVQMKSFKYVLASSIIIIVLSSMFCSENGDPPEMHLKRGIALSRSGEHEKSLREFTLAVRKKKDYADAYSAWGLALNGLERYEEAVKKFEKAVEIKPDNPLYYSNWGLALLNSGKYEQAAEKFRKAIELEPNVAGFHGNLGTALLRSNKIDEAKKEFETALDLFKMQGKSGEVKKVEEILKMLEDAPGES